MDSFAHPRLYPSPEAHKAKGIANVLVVLLAALVLICETPFLTRNLNRALVMLPVVLFFARFLFGRTGVKKQWTRTVWPVLAYLGLEAFYKFMGISTAELGYYVSTVMFLSVFLMMAAIGPDLSRPQQKFLALFGMGSLLANMGENVVLWLQHGAQGYGAFMFKGGWETDAADTAFSTAVMLLMGTLFIVATHVKTKGLKTAAWAGVVFSGYVLIYVLQKGTTFFLGIMLLMVLALPWTKFSRTQWSMVVALWILSFCVLFWFFVAGGAESVLRVLSGLLEGQRIQAKIDHLLLLLETGSFSEAGGSVESRSALMATSLSTFTDSVRNFFFGVGDHRVSIHDVGIQVGNHSQLLDTFARYGILGGACFVWLLSCMGKTMGDLSGLPQPHPLRKQLAVLFVFFLLRSLLGNTIKPSIAPQLFVVAPLVAALLASGEQQGNIRP